jgi:hypothetical protein
MSEGNMSESDYLTTQQAADLLGLADSMIRQLCLSGELPAEKYPLDAKYPPNDKYRGSWCIRREDVLRYKRQKRK